MDDQINEETGASGHTAGYLPLQLTLKGFKGIRSGLGREVLNLDFEALCREEKLIALSGANGRGKSTIIDNLHPYLVMPSHAGADGLGAFSYYDHVYLPESEKVLVWRSGGTRYKTHLVFRLNGRRKTEAFLFVEDGAGWNPVRLDDGTLVDGKVDTYEQAVTAILGAADTFFTSVFSAQGKRPLSAFKNSEIKSLLADLLGLEQVRTQGARAADTARLLKAGLGVVRAEQAQMAETLARLDQQVRSGGDPAAALQAAELAKSSAATSLAQVQASLSQLEAQATSVDATERRRAALRAEAEAAAAQLQEATRRRQAEGARLDQRAQTLVQRSEARQREHRSRLQQLQTRRATSHKTLLLAPAVDQAMRRQDVAQTIVVARRTRLAHFEATCEQGERLKQQLQRCRQDIEGIEREAGQLALRQSDLLRRFELVANVPCAGSDLQGRCQLLGDAHLAKALLPSVDGQLAQLAGRKRDVQALQADVETALKRLAGAAEARNLAERLLERAQDRLDGLRMTAARKGEVDQARAAAAQAEDELRQLGTEPVEQTEAERDEKREIGEARVRLQDEERVGQLQEQARLDMARRALGELPAPFDSVSLANARAARATAEKDLASAEARHQDAIRVQAQLSAVREQLEAARTKYAHGDGRAARIERELSQWNLLAKCLSNDGVIALDIDDAGPTFAALANDLLLASYGPRFTLQVCTQTATAKGELREDFDIIVHDGLRGESKSLKLVSGGERVWINECLTRAIALYLAGNTDRRYGTLFTDEADGALDPDRKRMFMQMKREVLRLGGYQREFFISQTPELTAMADVVIDLDAMAVETEEVAA